MQIFTNPMRRKEFIDKNRLNLIIYFSAFCAILFLYHFVSDGDFSFLLTLGGLTRAVAFIMLLVKFKTEKSGAGVSVKTLELYVVVFLARLTSVLMYEGYLPYDSSGDWLYQLLEILCLVLAILLIFSLLVTYRSSYNATEDVFVKITGIPTELNAVILALPCLVFAILLHPSLNRNFFTDIMWTWAMYLEACCMLPQFVMLRKSTSGAVDPWISHYAFTIGVSRLLTFMFWVSSYHELTDHNALIISGGWAGKFVLVNQFVSLLLMADFCYYYIKAAAAQSPLVLPGSVV